MNILINREVLLKPLQVVQGVVERRHTLAILGNLLMRSHQGEISFTATDMEVEITAVIKHDGAEEGETTVPAKKFMDIVKALDTDSEINFQSLDGQARIRSGRSQFKLATLPAQDYPVNDAIGKEHVVIIPASALKSLFEKTQFAMAQQDVRFYLNGLLLELDGKSLRAVATDGHRLALCEIDMEKSIEDQSMQIIVPRKAVTEISRLITDEMKDIKLSIGTQALQIEMDNISITTKLVDGRFPEYQRVIPEIDECNNNIIADREILKQGLQRAAILSNEKYRAVRLGLSRDSLSVLAHNPEQEQAEEEIQIEYQGDEMEVGFNVNYLIDALSAIKTDKVKIFLSDKNSSCLLLPEDSINSRYVVMPMRL